MLSCKILDSISAISPQDWRQLFGNTAEGYDFFQSLESSSLREFSFYYALVYQQERLILIAPLFVSDFNLDIAADNGLLKNFILGLRKIFPRFMTVKTLFCGSPFGENGSIGILPEAESKNAAVLELVKAMDNFCAQKRIPLIMFKDFLDADKTLFQPLLHQGFFEEGSFPNVIISLAFKSVEEYFQSLGYHTRKDLRRKIKKATSVGGLEVKIVDSVENIIDDIYRLYLNTYNAGNVKFEKLTKEFFINVARFMQPKTKFFLYYSEGKLVAFNLCFVHKDTLIDKFIGFDYGLAHKYNLYFFSWYYNVEWCLKNSISFYQVGQTDYYQKLKLGGRVIPLYVYLRHLNPAANLALRILARLIKSVDFGTAIKSDA
jgi:predicted N-acyltransferase